MLKDEEGFTLAEVLVTIIILASLAMVMAELVQSFIRSWERTEQRIEYSQDLLAQVETIAVSERALIGSESSSVFLTSKLQNDGTIILASPKINSSADCIYDVVARRCR